jgi:hypothetical protein
MDAIPEEHWQSIGPVGLSVPLDFQADFRQANRRWLIRDNFPCVSRPANQYHKATAQAGEKKYL